MSYNKIYETVLNTENNTQEDRPLSEVRRTRYLKFLQRKVLKRLQALVEGARVEEDPQLS